MIFRHILSVYNERNIYIGLPKISAQRRPHRYGQTLPTDKDSQANSGKTFIKYRETILEKRGKTVRFSEMQNSARTSMTE